MESNDSSSEPDLAGYLHIRGLGNVKSNKRHLWFILERKSNQLQGFKNDKDVDTKEAIESLHLFGAGISFGKTDDNEFIINIRGSEYRLYAESHKIMMKWTNGLQKQVKLKPVDTTPLHSTQLETVPENDPLELPNEGLSGRSSIRKKSSKKKGFFHRLFSRRGKAANNHKKDYATNEMKEERVVKAAPLRSVVGSMQDISTKSTSCKNCNLLQGHNSYLTTQVQQLTEDIENIKEQLRTYIRKFTSLERNQLVLKKDFIVFIQNTIIRDEGFYNSVLDIPASKKVLELLNEEKEADSTLPTLNGDGGIEPHEDDLGYIHGSRDTAVQSLLYICDLLKMKYEKILREEDNIYQQWQTYSASIVSEPNFAIDDNLMELVTHGIPDGLRGMLWKVLVMQHVNGIVKEKGENYYHSLTAKLPELQGDEDDDDGTVEKQIKIDLLRTMPTHKHFQDMNSGKIPHLHRILRAYILHNPVIGYCQGMNFMVGFGLLHLDEETSFWLLVAVMEVMFSKHHYNTYLSGTQANQRVMDELCREEFPDLMKHLETLFCELAPITFNWFMTVFIDSLPVQVVLKIWDIFLVYGHPILYKISLSLVRFNQASIMNGKDALSVMRKLKMLGRHFHNSDALLKEVFNGTFKHQNYLELYQKHLIEIEEESMKRQKEDEEYEKKKQKMKFTPKQMTVSISDNLDELDDDLIIKCGQCEVNRNYVWLLCTSDLMGQLFVFNVASRKLDPIEWQVDCKCLSLTSLTTSNIMLVSTIKSSLYAIDVETRKQLWKIQLAGSALDIACDNSGNVALSLMDGTVAFLNIKSKEMHQNYPTYVDISRSPVFCGCLVDNMFWCGAANKIIVIDIMTLETHTSLRVCPNERHTVSQLALSEYGVWASVKGSPVLHLWDKEKHVCLLTVDILDECGLASEKKKVDANAISITTILNFKDKLWVGFGNGRFIICDVNKKDNDDDLNDAITLFKSMENLSTAGIEGSKMKKSPSRLGVTHCCHQLDGPDKGSNSSVNDYVDAGTDFVMVDKRISTLDVDGPYEVALKMNQIQRVSEQPVNCFIPCSLKRHNIYCLAKTSFESLAPELGLLRLGCTVLFEGQKSSHSLFKNSDFNKNVLRQDSKLVLSCMGALNDDSSVILWSSEKREGREMWFAQTVSCNE